MQVGGRIKFNKIADVKSTITDRVPALFHEKIWAVDILTQWLKLDWLLVRLRGGFKFSYEVLSKKA